MSKDVLMVTRLGPGLICGLFFVSAIIYGVAGDWRKAAYSGLAGMLNAVALL